ncbi:MAG: GAF domain-containing protein [Myxococcota bacterium]
MTTVGAMVLADDARLERIFGLAARATQARPLPVVLQQLATDVAATLPADIVSVYLRAEGNGLTMRANVGFPAGAVNNVGLAMGEGITGFAAEIQRPVAREQASEDEHFAPVAGLDESAFPAFLALPILRDTHTLGVLVLQRRTRFDDAELALATALVSTFGLAIEHGRALQAESRSERGEGAGRQVRLGGRGVAAGVRLGRVEPLVSLQRLAEEAELEHGTDEALDTALIDALEALGRRLERALLPLDLDASLRASLQTLMLTLQDSRFRKQLRAEVAERGLAAGLAALARRYALAPFHGARPSAESDWLAQRASEMGALVRLLAARLADHPLCRPGDVLVLNERPGGLLALEATARRAAAVIVADRLEADALAVGILRAARIPTVVELVGLTDWARPGDPILVDGDAGAVHVNPSPSMVAKARQAG